MGRRPRSRLWPVLESLEGRALLTFQVPDSVLFTPIPETVPLQEHIHQELKILIDGVPQTVPAGIGLRSDGALPLHTHDATGLIHVESPTFQPYRLGDFFKIGGQPFDSKHILNYTADRKHKITMTVNGFASRQFQNLKLFDLQTIVIRYTTIGRHRVVHPTARS